MQKTENKKTGFAGISAEPLLAVITGCLRIVKESIFIDVNTFKTFSILDKNYGSAFGFTEDEVGELLTEIGFAEKLDTVKEWYDGYIFGDTEIFCPWDVLNYVDDLMNDAQKEPLNYWKDISSNEVIDAFVGEERFDVSDKFEVLMNDG